MFDSKAIGESFGKAARQYDEHAYLQKEVRAFCLRIAQPLWPEHATILDLGCGTGRLLNEIKKPVRLFGLDIASGMCHQSQRAGLRTVQATGEQLPFAAGTFDGVFSSLMLQWVARPSLVFAEIARVLRPGGTAVITTLAEGTLKELKDAFAALDGLPHVSEFAPPHTLLCCAGEAGLSLALARQETICEYYSDTVALMRALKAIGANNKHAGRGKGMMTPAKLARLEQTYIMRYAGKKGLPASWQVLLLVLKKESA